MPNIPHAPLYTYHHHTIILNQNRSFRNKQTSNHSTVSPSTSLRLRGLAQASPPPPRRGLKQERESSTGSRLGEVPLAWASCVLAQNTLWSPERPLAQKALGEPLHISPGRVYQCLPLFVLAQRIHAPNRGSSQSRHS